MELREYIFFEKMTITSFAELVGVTRDHISGVIHGRYNASRKLAKRIYRATQGQVDMRDERDKL
jgi:plasmid maintenance system antidote protein VapI